MASTRNVPAPPTRMPSSTVTTRPWAAASASIAGSGGDTTRTSHTVASMPSAASLPAASSAASTILPTARRHTVPSPAVRPGAPRARTHGAVARLAGRGLREADGRRAVEARAPRRASPRPPGPTTGRRRSCPGWTSVRARSRTPWWLGPSSPVIPARSRTKTTGRPVQPDVEVGLVEGAAEEGGVDGHHRAQPGHGHAGRRGHRVLLGDARRRGTGRGTRPGRAGARWVRAWPR